ncbi:LysR family transcriptional regulator [Pseudomonas sp. USTB-Z]|jgi:DNA-binding transcriptional LysR family regulator|uniref:LysR substrate-binding domain-containing protein n=1 Tax=Pseudomonas TaxID=286 RepID=UPI0018AA8182|nr:MULTISPECIES: LysR substrate-binding domain-containing protein [Pseudomonas]MBF8789652.1 LysR family transcriptional regulator [Pseudomonas asiatica]MBX6689189.1 LysR family transcriptional regulator [Pseudomonas sp. USTB-Z]
MHLDFKDLNLFIHIAEAPSLTQGAKKAFISPAAASVRMKALEAQLNTHLLYRDSKGVELTEAGRRLLKHARLIMRQMAYLKTEFNEYGADSSGHIRIFANTTAVTEFLPEVLARYLASNPGVTVDLQERLTRDIVRGVLEGSTDMGIVAGPVATKELEVLHYSTDRLVIVVPEGHVLDTTTSPKFVDTLAYHHVGMQEGSTLQEFMREQAERLGEKLSWRIQVSSFESVCRMVEANVGIGIIPQSAAIRHSKTMKLSIVQLDEPWAIRERSILVRELDALPGCVRKLISLLRADQAEKSATQF